VAGGALAAIIAFRELSFVLIAVAIHALLKCQRLFEISFAVAGDTVHLLVFPEQWVFGFGMIKTLVECCSGNALPAGSVVA
jgi:hypothetical protein